MEKIYIFYIVAFFSIILMFITLNKISKKKVFEKYNKTLLILITIFIPLLGFILVMSEDKK